MKVAALDLGSNTFLCLICDVINGKVGQTFADDVEVVRLGQDLARTGKFHPEALARAENTLLRFRKLIDQHQPEKIRAVATSAARDAENKSLLYDMCTRLNIPLEIISGENESRVTYEGSVSAFQDDVSRLVVDIGGGSTEFILGRGNRYLSGHSHDIGCVRLTEKFIKNQPTSSDELEICRAEIARHLDQSALLLGHSVEQILAVAGTPTALATAEIGMFDPSKIDGYKLSEESLISWFDRLSQATVSEKIQMGIPAGRADVILVGVLILLETLKKFKKNQIVVSTRGVRYGVAIQMEK